MLIPNANRNGSYLFSVYAPVKISSKSIHRAQPKVGLSTRCKWRPELLQGSGRDERQRVNKTHNKENKNGTGFSGAE